MVVGSASADRTARRRIGRGGDGVGDDLLLEVGHVGGVLGDVEAEACVGGDHRAVLGPVHEIVARVGRGGECAACALVVGSAACDRAACGRVGRCGDGVGDDLLLEVGHVGGVLGDVEAEACVGGDHRAVLGPVHEIVARVGRGGQGAALADVVGSSAADSAAFGRVGRCGDGDTTRGVLEVGHIVAGLSHREGVSGVG